MKLNFKKIVVGIFLLSLKLNAAEQSNPYSPLEVLDSSRPDRFFGKWRWTVPSCIVAFRPSSAILNQPADSVAGVRDFENIVRQKVSAGSIRVRVFEAAQGGSRKNLWLIEPITRTDHEEWLDLLKLKNIPVNRIKFLGPVGPSVGRTSPARYFFNALMYASLFLILEYRMEYPIYSAFESGSLKDWLDLKIFGEFILLSASVVSFVTSVVDSFFLDIEVGEKTEDVVELVDTISPNSNRRFLILDRSLPDRYFQNRPWRYLRADDTD